jgi:hypothetical protein
MFTIGICWFTIELGEVRWECSDLGLVPLESQKKLMSKRWFVDHDFSHGININQNGFANNKGLLKLVKTG